MTAQKSASKRPPLAINPFEQLRDLVSDTAQKAPREIVNTFIPGPEIWKSPTPKPESIPGGPNFTPVKFDQLQKKYQEQDSPDIESVRQQLMGIQQKPSADLAPQPTAEQLHMSRHNQYLREIEEHHLKLKREKAEEERQEELEKQQEEQKEADQKAASQQQSTPHGKVRKNILGGGHKKANMDLPPEVRHETKGGAGKH